jgi:hypothetical protein
MALAREEYPPMSRREVGRLIDTFGVGWAREELRARGERIAAGTLAGVAQRATLHHLRQAIEIAEALS